MRTLSKHSPRSQAGLCSGHELELLPWSKRCYAPCFIPDGKGHVQLGENPFDIQSEVLGSLCSVFGVVHRGGHSSNLRFIKATKPRRSL